MKRRNFAKFSDSDIDHFCPCEFDAKVTPKSLAALDVSHK
jgi:hypothetical protein